MNFKCEKVGKTEALSFLPQRIDSEILDLVGGYAEWGIKANIIQVAGWPWAAVSIEYATDIAKLLSLWNASKRKSDEEWFIFPSGDKLIIPHPIVWETSDGLLRQGQEFGIFLKKLPFDSLTELGFEQEVKKMKSSTFSVTGARAAVSRLLKPLCPE